MTAQTAPYVSLNRRNKRGAIAGAGLLWFYNLIFSFTMPVALPMILFSNSFGVAIFNAVYNIFYNARYAQAVALGGGEHLAAAMADTFSAMAAFSTVCGAILFVLALVLIPRGKET